MSMVCAALLGAWRTKNTFPHVDCLSQVLAHLFGGEESGFLFGIALKTRAHNCSLDLNIMTL